MATDHDFKIKNGARVSGEKLILGSSAYSTDANYVGLKTSAMTGSTEYMIISSPTDKHTYISAGSGKAVYIRGGGNNTAHQLIVENTGATFAGNLTVSGNFTVNGTTLTVDTTNLQVQDNNITLNYSTGDSSSSANGAGITIQDAVNSSTDAFMNWNATHDLFNFSHSATFGYTTIDPDLFLGTSGGFGNIADGSGWGARGLFIHGGGTGDAAAIGHNGVALYFGIQNGSTANSMDTWLTVQPNKSTTFAAQLSVTGHGNSNQWNTAYGWGDHSTQGYITNATASLNADKITAGVLNYARIPIPVNGDWWNNGYVRVQADGVMEVGKYLDFHTSDSGGNTDFDVRVTATPGAIDIDGDLTVDDITASDITTNGITTTGILTVDTSPASNGTGDLKIIHTLNTAGGVGYAGQVIGVNIEDTVNTSNQPEQNSTWGGVTGATAIALQADDNSYGQFQVWTSPQTSSAGTALTPRFWIDGIGDATFSRNIKINGTTVIDTSRNLTNIGTISSGAINTSGELKSTSTSAQAIKTRFIAGAANGSTSDGPLYLQYGRGQDIRMFENSGQNRKLYIYGNDNGTDRWGGLSVGTDGSFTVQASDTYLVLQAAGYIQSNNPHNFTSSLMTSGTTWLDSNRNATFANLTATGLTTLGRTASDRGATSDTNTALIATSRGVDHTSSRTNVLRLQRDGTSGVVYSGIADIDLERWETSGVTPRTAMHFRLAHANLSTYDETTVPTVMTLRSNGTIGIGTTAPSKPLHVKTSLNEGIFLEGTSNGVWMDVQSGASELWSMGADTNGWAIYNRTDSAYRLRVENGGDVDIVSGGLKVGATTVIDSAREIQFTKGASGTLASRTGFSDFIGYNPSYGSYIGGGVNNGSSWIYSGGYISQGGVHTLWHSGNDGSGSGLDADLLDGQHGSYYLAASSYTASDVLTKIKTVDGSGSGLDADTVDGINSGSFLRSDTSDTFGSTSSNKYIRFNCNSGQYIASGGLESRFPIEIFSPTANGGDAGLTFHISGDYAGFFGLASDWNDLAWGGWSVGSTTKYRIAHTGNFSSTGIWYSGNDGSGSGLDADTVDGIQASSFLRTDANDTASGQYSFTKVNDHAIRVGTIRGTVVGSQSGEYIQMYERVHIGSPVGWGSRGAPSYGLSTYGGADLATDTGSVTISGSTAWHAGNDGSGTGLDADTLDGVQGSQFLRSDASDTMSGTLTFGSGSGFDLATFDIYGSMRVIRNNKSGSDGMYIGYLNSNSGMTRIFGGGQGSGGIYVTGSGANDIKYNNSSVFWHAGNDGAGSGLDADTVDGYQFTNHEGVGDYEMFLVYGDSDKYYPVVITGGAGHSSDFKIWRAYNEAGPDDWNTSTHKGGLTFRYRISGSSGWGGHPNRIKVLEAEEIYTTLLGGINYTAHTMKHVVWLRGGGTNGARYHMSSTSAFSLAIYTDTSSGYTSGSGWLSYDSSNNSYDTYVNYRTLTERNNSMEGEVYNTMPVTYGTGQVRHVLGGTGPSKTYWNSSNDGGGSGLDADTLDGVQGASFLRSDAADSATGALTFSGTILSQGHSSGANWMPFSDGNFYIRAPNVFFDSSTNVEFNDEVRVVTGSIAESNSTKGLMFDGNYETGQYRHRFRKRDLGSGIPLYIDYSHGTANSYSAVASFGGPGSSYNEFTVYGDQDIQGQLVIDNNIASPANYFNALQMEIRAQSGTAGIGLHRNGYSHAGIYHDASNTLKVNFNSGTVTINSGMGTLWGSGNDGSGSGLDADLLDGINSSSFLRSDQSDTMSGELNVSRNGGVTGTSAPQYSDVNIELQTSSNHVPGISFHRGGYSATTLYEYDGELYVNAWTARAQTGKLVSFGNDGSGSGLDADTLDGVQGSSYLRSDTNQTFTGDLTIDSSSGWNSGNGMLNVGGTGDARLQVRHIWGKSSTSAGTDHLWLNYQNTGKGVQIGSSGGSNNLYVSGALYAGGYFGGNLVWNAGNDGSGSGLDADLLDGLDLHTGRNNEVNKVVRTDSNGYIQAGWINTTSGALTTQAIDRVYASTDGYIRYYTAANFGARIGSHINYNDLANKPTIPTNNNQLTNGAGYITTSGTASQSHAVTGSSFATTASPGSVLEYQQAASITDTKLAPSSDWYNSIRMGHGNPYSYYSNTMAVKMTGGNVGQLYIQTISNNNAQGWRQVWDSSNDGPGSGLDADTLDTIQASSFLRSDAADTASGKITFTAAESIELTGIRGAALGSQTGDFIHLYERVNIGYPNGWGGQGAPSYGLSTHGGAQFNVGNVSNAPFTFNGNTVWHAGNDGSGSGLDADLLDGSDSTAFPKLAATNTWGNNHINYFRVERGATCGATNTANLQAYTTGANSAFMSFHRSGSYAVNFGLDSDNILRIGGWSASANRWVLDMNGNMTAAGNVTAYSDIRLKENIEVIPNALEKIKQIRGVTFTRNDQEDKEARHTGVIAQEVEKVLPEVISEDNLGIKNVAYGNMVGLLIEAVKELKQEVDDLKAQLKEK